MKRRPKLQDLTWRYNVWCDGQIWTTEEWICEELPDLRCRVHKKKGTRVEFAQFYIRGDVLGKFANLKQAYRALMKRKAIRIGYGKTKTKSRRGARKARRVSRAT